ncbi:MAG: hypothetical protein WAU01_12915 [Saprospiraceae bacterium]
MNRILKTAIHPNIRLSVHCKELLQWVSELDINVDFSLIVADSITLSNEILSGNIDLGIYRLDQLPFFDENQNLVITALTGEHGQGETLAIRADKFDPTKDLRISHGATIWTQHKRQSIQLQHLNPNIEIKEYLLTDDEFAREVKDHHPDAFIYNPYVSSEQYKNIANYRFVHLHPTEVIGLPGHNIIAYVTQKDNIELRRILKTIHVQTLVQKINLERTVLQLAGREFGNKIGVYCHQDSYNNFHVHAVRWDDYKKVSTSQSTTSGLAEKICELLF